MEYIKFKASQSEASDLKSLPLTLSQARVPTLGSKYVQHTFSSDCDRFLSLVSSYPFIPLFRTLAVSQTDPIQALIQDIDEVLQKTTMRLPWVMSNDAMQQRQVLEQARTYLADLQSGQAGSPTASQRQIEEAQPQPQTSSEALLPSGQPAAESAQQVLQSVLQEMNYLRVNLLQPMRSDVELLRQQREALTHEIRQLEARQQGLQLQANPQQVNSQILMEFLQSAMAQMQENLRGQVVQIVANLATADQPRLGGSDLGGSDLGSSDLGSSDLGGSDLSQSGLGTSGLASLSGSEAIAALSPVQRLEQIQRVQLQSDQLLLKLDSTVQIIFESLQSNLQSYQDSLEQGLSRIHNLGQQGEVMVAALVNRLAEQVGREASSFLQATAQSTASPTVQPTPAPPTDRSGADRANPNQASANQASANQATDTEIARLLEELNALDASPSGGSQPNESPSSQTQSGGNRSGEKLDQRGGAIDMRWQPQPFTLDATPGSMAALSQELRQLDLSAVPIELDSLDDEDLTIFQTDFQTEPPLTSLALNYRAVDRWEDDDERTLFQVGSELSLAPVFAPTPEEEDLESALDLLNQLGAAARAAADAAIAAEAAEQAKADSTDSTDSPVEPDQPPMVSSPENLYEDEFYQTLFGDPDEELPKAESNSESPLELPSQPLDSAAAFEPEMAFGELFSGTQEGSSPEISPETSPDANPDANLEPEAAPIDAAKPEPLFAGLSDPAIAPVQAATTAFLSDFPELPQSMENFLLSDPAQPALEEAGLEDLEGTAIATETETAKDSNPLDGELDQANLFWDAPAAVTPESLSEQPDAPVDAVETIRTLTDLIPSADSIPGDAERSLDLEGFSEDAFEPAEASENLLVLETSQVLPIAELEIDQSILQQLTADLSNLDQASSLVQPRDRLQDQSDSTAPNPASSTSIEDLFAEVEDRDRPSPAAGETLEELLFTADLSPAQPAELEAETDNSNSANSNSANDLGRNEPDSSNPDSNNPDLNAFTLIGFDSLFETLSAPDAAKPDAGDRGASIEDMFGDRATPESASESESTKKKN
jgi:hypothetical protein